MNKIKELRKERGWNQKQLGQLLNVQNTAFSKYENGHIPLTDENIHMLCDVFNVSADYIIGRTEKRVSDEHTSYEIQILIDSCADLTDEELKKVLEYIDFLKTKREQ